MKSFAAAKASLVFIKNRCKSSRLQMFFKIGVIKNLAMFTGKQLLELVFNKVADLQVFSCEYCKIAKSSFFMQHLRWLLLEKFCLTLYFQKDVAEYIIYCTFTLHNCFILKPKITLICFHSLHHSLSFVVPLVAPPVVIRCTSRCHSFPLFVTRCTTRCHLMYQPSVFL